MDFEPSSLLFQPKKRETLDLGSALTRELSEDRFYRSGWSNDWRSLRSLHVHPSKKYRRYLLEPNLMARSMSETVITSRYCHTALNKSQVNKSRCPVTQTRWTPEGRWLITGAQNGEFTLWNGLDFSFNRVIQGHEKAIKSICWSRSSDWMISGDQEGRIKVWNSAIAFMKEFKQEGALDRAHSESIRGLTFSPTDAKIASCADDLKMRIWDFGNQVTEERIIETHDVRAIDWHQTRALILTGSRDHLCKLWDPKSGRLIRTIPGHKQTVNVVRWHPTDEHLFLSASRDCTVRVHDLRMLAGSSSSDSCFLQWKAHDVEVNCASWHPSAPDLLVSGAHDGSLSFWLLGGNATPATRQAYIPAAHEGAIWDCDWNPLGHLLVTGSNDHTAKFWTRPKPGDGLAELYRGYNRDRNQNEIGSLLASGGQLPIDFAALQAESLAHTAAEVKRRLLAEAAIPGLGLVGRECAERAVGLLLAPPSVDSSTLLLQSSSAGVSYEQLDAPVSSSSNRPPQIRVVKENRTAADFPQPRYRGTVRRWDEKGFGFIIPFDPSLPQGGIFAHASSIVPNMGWPGGKGDSDVLNTGNQVEFSVEMAENYKTREKQPKCVDIVDEAYFSKTEAFRGVDSAPTTAKSRAPPRERDREREREQAPPPITYYQPPPLPPPPVQAPAKVIPQFNPEYLAGVRFYLESGQQALVEENLAQHGLTLQDIYPALYPQQQRI